MNTLWRAALAVVAATLAGCGGGSGGSGGGDGIVAPPAPVLSLVPQRTKTFHFSWEDVRGESEYRLLEDADGTSGYTAVATIAANQTSYDLAVFLPERVNARYVLQACNHSGCADSASAAVTGSLANAVGYLKASNTGRLDLFGSAIALSGDGSTLAVAALTEASSATGVNGNQTDDSAVQSGAVYVFTHTGTEWRQQAYVKASNTGHTDLFGSSVSLSGNGDTLVVGAPYEDSDATGINGDQTNNLASGSGAVYVFSRTGTDWHQQAYLKASITLIDHRFGARVRLSDDGNTLAIAADGSRPGQYVYSRNGSDWRQQVFIGPMTVSDAALSRDGNTLAVGNTFDSSGARGINGNEADTSAVRSGAVYVYLRTGTEWRRQAYIKASNADPFDSFGSGLALSANGDTLVVGAEVEASSVTGVNGDQTDNSASMRGAVYVFSRSGSDWRQQAYLKASNLGVGEVYFGSSVALSADGNRVAISAPKEDSSATGINGNQVDTSAPNSGAVYLFIRSGLNWSQRAFVKAPNTGTEDSFASVALSADGKILAVGAIGEDSGATGINGNQADDSFNGAGAVYIY